MNLDKGSNFFTDKSRVFNIVLIITIILVGLFLFKKQDIPKNIVSTASTTAGFGNKDEKQSKTLYVDIEGALVNPGVYEIEDGKRINDVILLAGGFTKDVHYSYVIKNVNKAQKLSDGMKLYIPFSSEDVEADQSNVLVEKTSEDSGIININSASSAQLDTLEGVGEVTLNKIIQNRPYSQLNDLIDRKVVTQAQFDKIKDKITI